MPNIAVSTQLTSRYTDAYRVAAVIVGVGKTVRAIGALVAIVLWGIFMFPLLDLKSGGPVVDTAHFGAAQFTVAATGLVAGFVAWLVGYAVGTLISAQGQLLRAALDTAVFSCPLISTVEKIGAMGLKGYSAVGSPERQAAG